MTSPTTSSEEVTISSDEELLSLSSSRFPLSIYPNGIHKSKSITTQDPQLLHSTQFLNDEIINTSIRIILHSHHNHFFLICFSSTSWPRTLNTVLQAGENAWEAPDWPLRNFISQFAIKTYTGYLLRWILTAVPSNKSTWSHNVLSMITQTSYITLLCQNTQAAGKKLIVTPQNKQTGTTAVSTWSQISKNN